MGYPGIGVMSALAAPTRNSFEATGGAGGGNEPLIFAGMQPQMADINTKIGMHISAYLFMLNPPNI
jgi:hypothetical protein